MSEVHASFEELTHRIVGKSHFGILRLSLRGRTFANGEWHRMADLACVRVRNGSGTYTKDAPQASVAAPGIPPLPRFRSRNRAMM